MFEMIVGFVCGFGVAYLVIRAIRSFGGGVGLVLVLLPLQVGAQCETEKHRFIMTGANGQTFSVHVLYENTGSGWSALSEREGAPDACVTAGSLNEVNDYAVQTINGAWNSKTHGWRVWNDTLGAQAGSNGTYYQDAVPTPVTKYFTSGGPAGVTNYTANFGLTNSGPLTAQYKVRFYTNGVQAGSAQQYELDPGDSFNYGTTNAFGVNQGYTYTVEGPGDLTNDYQRKLVASGDAVGVDSGVTDTSGNVPTQVNVDPINTFQSYTPSFTNPIVAARQDAEAIRSTLSEGFNQLRSVVQAQGTNGGSGSLTNAPDYSAVLDRIRTNTQWTGESGAAGTNLLTAMTNFLHSTTNVSSYTNMLAEGLKYSSNAMAGVALWETHGGSKFAAISNAVEAGRGAWTAAVDNPAPSIMAVALPGGRTMNFDLLTGTDWAAKIFGPASFIKRILIGVITFVLFWLAYDMLQGRSVLVAGQLANTVRTPDGEPGDLILKKVLATAIIEAAVLIAAFLPTVVVGVMDGYGWEALPSGASLPYQLMNNGGVDGASGTMTLVAQRFYHVLGEFVPWATLWVGVVNLLAFRIFLDRVFFVVSAMVRAFGVYTSAVVLGMMLVEGEAAEIEVHNFVQGSLQISNAVEVLTLPLGVTKLPLAAGSWWCGTNEFEVIETGVFDPTPRLRFAGGGGTNSPPVYMVAMSDTVNVEVGFWLGWESGLMIFGFAWMVSAVRQGLTIAYRDHGL